MLRIFLLFSTEDHKDKTSLKKTPLAEFKSIAVLLYFQGVSELLRHCLEQQGIRTFFKSDTTLPSHFMRPKDTVDPAKQGGIVYKTLYEYGKVYIWETGKSIQESIKEHDRDIRLARSQETGHYPI